LKKTRLPYKSNTLVKDMLQTYTYVNVAWNIWSISKLVIVLCVLCVCLELTSTRTIHL